MVGQLLKPCFDRLFCRNLRKQRRQDYYERKRRRGWENNMKNIETVIEEPTADAEEEFLEECTKPFVLKKTE